MFHGNLDVVEVNLFEISCLKHCTLDKSLRCRGTVFLKKVLVERSSVDADPNGDPSPLGGPCNLLDVVLLANVPRVEPKTGNSCFDRCKSKLVLKMDIRNEWNR
ncbi:hypothetical protein BMS3Bbin02_00795 [bacterium BMS3Bbin02]|nr:hypothetical protein BMS3Bbin02_00795 [bacterium BMS3Bbin02]